MSYGINAPVGFRPSSYMSGAPWTGKFSYYLIQSGYGTSIFEGDLVSRVANANGFIKNLLPTEINQSDPPALGVFLGCEYVQPNAQSSVAPVTPSPFWPAGQQIKPGTLVYAKVIDDPDVIFDIQANGVVNLNQMGGNANFTLGVGGSTVTGLSSEMLDTAAIVKGPAPRGEGQAVLTGNVPLIVPAAYIQANSLVMVTKTNQIGAAGNLTITIQPGVSFTIVSSQAGDVSPFNWKISPGVRDNSFLPIKLLNATQVLGNEFDPITGAGILYNNISVILNNHAYRVGTQGV